MVTGRKGMREGDIVDEMIDKNSSRAGQGSTPLFPSLSPHYGQAECVSRW